MGIADRLKEQGFKPESNVDGEWKPYNGTYRCLFKTLRADYDEKNQGAYVQGEWDIEEVLTGDMKRDSKFPAFRRRYYFDFDNPSDDQLENAKDLANDVFTATGKEIDLTDKLHFIASAEPIIGQEAYIRAWGFTFEKDKAGNVIPEDQRKQIQSFVVQKKAVAEKKRSADSIAF